MKKFEMKKEPIVEEDLGLNDTPKKQNRDGKLFDVTPLQLFKIVRNIEQLRSVDFDKFPQAVIFGGVDGEVGNNTFYKWNPLNHDIETIPQTIISDLTVTGRWEEQQIGVKGNFVTVDTEQEIEQQAIKKWNNLNKFYGSSFLGQFLVVRGENAQNLKFSFCDLTEEEAVAALGFETAQANEFIFQNNKPTPSFTFNAPINLSTPQDLAFTQKATLKLNEDDVCLTNNTTDGEFVTDTSIVLATEKLEKKSAIKLNSDDLILNNRITTGQIVSDSDFVLSDKSLNKKASFVATDNDLNINNLTGGDVSVNTKLNLLNSASSKQLTLELSGNDVLVTNNSTGKIKPNVGITFTSPQNIEEVADPIKALDAVNKQTMEKSINDAIDPINQTLTEHEQLIGANTEKITENTKAIQSNAQSIASNSQNIVNLGGRVDTLETRVDMLSSSHTSIIGVIQQNKDQVEANRNTILNGFVQTEKSRLPKDGDVVFTQDSFAYYYDTDHWTDPIPVAIPLFSTDKAGRIKGSVDNPTNAGRLKPVGNQGEAEVIGFTTLQEQVQTLETESEKWVTLDTQQEITGHKTFRKAVNTSVMYGFADGVQGGLSNYSLMLTQFQNNANWLMLDYGTSDLRWQWKTGTQNPLNYIFFKNESNGALRLEMQGSTIAQIGKLSGQRGTFSTSLNVGNSLEIISETFNWTNSNMTFYMYNSFDLEDTQTRGDKFNLHMNPAKGGFDLSASSAIIMKSPEIQIFNKNSEGIWVSSTSTSIDNPSTSTEAVEDTDIPNLGQIKGLLQQGSSSSGNFVTTNTEQDVTARKIFTVAPYFRGHEASKGNIVLSSLNNAATYIGFFSHDSGFNYSRKAYLGYPIDNGAEFVIKNEKPGNKVKVEGEMIASNKLTAVNNVLFGSSIKAGYGGRQVKLTPDDNSTKELQLYDPSVGANCWFNINLGNKGEISGIKTNTLDATNNSKAVNVEMLNNAISGVSKYVKKFQVSRLSQWEGVVLSDNLNTEQELKVTIGYINDTFNGEKSFSFNVEIADNCLAVTETKIYNFSYAFIRQLSENPLLAPLCCLAVHNNQLLLLCHTTYIGGQNQYLNVSVESTLSTLPEGRILSSLSNLKNVSAPILKNLSYKSPSWNYPSSTLVPFPTRSFYSSLMLNGFVPFTYSSCDIFNAPFNFPTELQTIVNVFQNSSEARSILLKLGLRATSTISIQNSKAPNDNVSTIIPEGYITHWAFKFE